jgi:hypothetical protein
MKKKIFTLWLCSLVFMQLDGKSFNDSLAKTSIFSYNFLYANPKKHKTLKPEVRPFITDDSRVVGKELFQIESWTRLDRDNFQWWALAAYGPTEWLEVTTGGVFGWDIHPEQGFAYALPLVQAKILFKEYAPGKMPGIGAVVGSFLPYGQGSFKPPGYGTFGFLTVSQCFGDGEKVLIHANTGFNYLHIAGENEWLHTWGFGTQIKTYKGFHLVAEIFSGDPYVPGSGTSWQAGFRHFISDEIQLDGTIGKGIAGDEILPLWGSVGIRLVFDWFKKKE